MRNHCRYDDYKFVTRDEVDKLGITGLIGTPMLRAYMHGFFMDAKLHREAKTLSEPFAYEECVMFLHKRDALLVCLRDS